MKMVEHAPKVFSGLGLQDAREQATNHEYQEAYTQQGYSYGEDPVLVKEALRIEYITPGPKSRHNESKTSSHYPNDSQKQSTDKKRKRLHVEELDLTAARRPSQEPDIDTIAPPVILHSGLTGGLNRLLSKSTFPPSPDYSNGDPSPISPLKRSKHTIREKDEGVSRGRNGVLVKVRKRRSSDESRPRKHQRSHHSPEHHKHDVRPKHKAIEDRPKRKAIEYHSQPRPDDSQQQLVVFKTRAELFMSFVTKGPGSEQGYSVHKALKRYHRERGEQGLGLEKVDEEKELFKHLRLKRNDRGEVVVFFS
jgi:cell growth-regulating nucleolar protein